MRELQVKTRLNNYSVIIEGGGLHNLGSLLNAQGNLSKTDAIVITEPVLWNLLGSKIESSLKQSGFSIHKIEFLAGEERKNLHEYCHLVEQIAALRAERNWPVLALGGGVTGDTVGFVAASYLRGVPLIQIPTTLLSMVDSSVGGKVGVNLPQGKNLVGSFYPPSLVLIDPDVLGSMSDRDYACGLAECVKHGMLGDRELFDWTEKHAQELKSRQPQALEEFIFRNVSVKAGIVQSDETEQGARRLLNLGHTFGHAIEATSGYGNILHGEAVSLGLVAAARLSRLVGNLSQADESRIYNLLELLGLPTSAKLAPVQSIIEAMAHDKKSIRGKVRFVLLRAIGEAYVSDAEIDLNLVRDALTSISKC